MNLIDHIIPKVTITDLAKISVDAPHWLMNHLDLTFELPYTGKMIRIDGTAGFAVGSIILYLVLITLVFPAMQPKPETVKKFAVWHYGALFVYSFATFLATLYYLIDSGDIWSYEAILCRPVPAWLRLVSMAFTVSKIWEWGDTAELLWRQGQKWGDFRKIDFLHTYHHATTFFLFLHVMTLPGTEKTGMFLNSFVHTLMYYHFAFRLPKSYRPIITAAQILQLASVTYFHTDIPRICPAFNDYPSQYPFEFLVVYFIVPVYLLLFIKFFWVTYVTPSPKKETSDAARQSKSKSA